MAAPMTSHVNVDSIISKLLAVRGSRPGTKVYLTESEIRYLCLQSRAIFLSQPMLLELHVEAPLIVMGDIYGQYYDLLRLFEFRGFPPETNYLLLGNYVDKGKQSIETICLLLAYKIKYPENFFLLRGNHEAASMNYIFGFYDECKRRLNIRLWKTFTDCFNCLPVAAIIDKLIFCCHSGLSPDLQSMEQIRGIRRPTDVPNHGLLCDLLWAYPDHEAVGWGEPDPEGRDGKYSFSFGPEIVSKFLAKHDFDLICRGNDYVEDGYEFFAKEQLVTIFSAPNYLGEYNNAGAMMTIDKTLMCSFPILKPEIASDRRKFFGPKTPHPVADDTEDELFSASAAAAKEQQKRDEESEDEDVSVAIDASATVEEQSENEQSEDEDVSVAIDASATVEEQSENEQSEDEDVSVAIDASATVEEQSENEQSEDEDRRHYEAYQQALQTGVNVAIKYLKLLLIGPPRTGKTALRRRILGEIINLLSLAIQPSTGAVDAHNVVVKLTKEKMTCLAATISESTWRAVGHGEEKTDLDEELHLLYQFITEGSVGLTSTVSDEPQMMSGQESTKNQRKKRRFNISDLVNRFRKKKKVVISGAAVTKIPSTLSDSEMKEIENTLEAFNTALKSHAGRQQLKVLLEKTILLNMVDTGGQPAFIEMLPMLTIGPALYLIFLRLDQELKQRYKIKYVGEDNEEVSLGESSYTFQEVIFQVLSSITCFGSDTSSSTSVQEKPQITSQQSQAAMLVGTYKDKLEGNPDEVQSKIKQIDRALQEELKEVLDTDLFEADRNLLRFASIDQLMFDVDNMTGSEDEVKKIRKRLEEVILHDFNEVPIPASWLMFGLFLRRMGKHLMSLYHCEEISRRLHVNDVREAIGFLHHCIGVLMYYPDVEELKDVVICDPQIVFDSVTELILNTFKFGPVGKAACDKFKQTGQFCFSEIEKLSKTLKSGILPLPQLVKLLEYLYIIARIFWQEESGAEVRDENVVYFMPAVLPSASESELNVSHSPVDPAPLLIRFKSGIVPVGLFCASTASLVAQKKKLGWTLMEPQPAGSQCSYALHKNRVTFRVNRCNSSYDVALISKPKRYEVHITLVRSSSARPSHEICKHVLETVCQTLDHVISKMKHKQYLAQSASNSHTRCPYELGFQCPLHPNKDHMAVFRPYCKQVEPSLSAADKWFNYFESGNTTLLCLDENVVVHLTNSQSHNTSAGDSLQCHGEEDSLAAPHAGSDQMYSLWMGPPQVDLYIHAVLSIANAPLTYLNVTTSLKTLVDWHKLGVMLEIEKSTLDSIRIDYDRWGTARQRSEMVDVWLRSDTQASWSKLCRALESMNESVLSRQIRSKYCHHHN